MFLYACLRVTGKRYVLPCCLECLICCVPSSSHYERTGRLVFKWRCARRYARVIDSCDRAPHVYIHMRIKRGKRPLFTNASFANLNLELTYLHHSQTCCSFEMGDSISKIRKEATYIYILQLNIV